ncbi:Spermidine/putrescine import ATP-binding protein PotA [Corynebacterium pseudotuberculosis]|uniref:ABC transporter ATP-binding protein n=1 Tax=Corynebacterium pseudotuberculosis TaxID=1719 RepID=UPI0002504513|nr:ABC transporter ATP-binding protein [Corynebacterium pseudotuberculosis]AFB73304.1 ATP-binding cassette domain-containing protein [Corynebacterium pseudotuberculosis 316]APQ55040.1 Spermidine/putrescine import ATP-binding protein PotA [Corynebacterium pseudotuberculosis]ASC76297.2 ATP-binding cassette domain-containing protein [Corynebacterium pseudotuberculosis]WAE78783.1 ABC transporter ATP-binding protein [Corynebacterium pseudotuberculosis]WAE91075.1 ABC transporter ATP-binding protein 
MLDVRNLCFSYASTRLMALESVSMCCSKGQWLSLIGPNGCGKSTLFSVIAGVRRQTSGEVYVDGASARMRKRKEWARTVALMPQHPTLPEGMRVIDYIKLGRYPHRSTNNDLIERTICDLDLQSFVASSITELSGGELQRVALARALVQEPAVLLLDEPTSALDIGRAQEVLELVDALRAARGLTVIAAMHDLTLAAEYSDEVMLLDRGRVVAHGTPVEVLTRETIENFYEATVDVTFMDSAPAVIPRRKRAFPRVSS